MSEAPVAHVGEMSPEQVAYELLACIADHEEKTIRASDIPATADRKWLLDTFAECLLAVREPRSRLDQALDQLKRSLGTR